MNQGIIKLREFMESNLGDRHNIPLSDRRDGLNRLSETLNPLPSDIHIKRETIANLSVTYFDVSEKPQDTIILLVHGGAFVAGSAKSHGILAANLSRLSGSTVVAVDYRLAPEHPFPAALDDIFEVYRTLLDRGFAAKKIAMVGDSAGGALVLSSLVDLKLFDVPQPSCAALISPCTDLTCSGKTFVSLAAQDPFISKAGFSQDFSAYAPDQDLSNPRLSPLFADLSGLPPLLVQVGSDETLLDDSKRLKQAAAQFDVPCRLEIWDDMVHCWHLFPNWLEEAIKATSQITEFIAENTTS